MFFETADPSIDDCYKKRQRNYTKTRKKFENAFKNNGRFFIIKIG